jgi:hypothetical protein
MKINCICWASAWPWLYKTGVPLPDDPAVGTSNYKLWIDIVHRALAGRKV